MALLRVEPRRCDRGRSLDCCDLSQLSNVEGLSTKSGDKAPHSKEHRDNGFENIYHCDRPLITSLMSFYGRQR